MGRVPTRLLVGIAVVVAAGVGVLIASASGGSSSSNASPGSPATTPSPTKTGIVGGPFAPAPGPAPAANLQPCNYPKERPLPDWVPKDLPLPEGTYMYRPLRPTQGFSLGLFAVKLDLQTFTRYILKEWPNAGFILGRGDAEPGEIETQFSKPPAFGAIKAQSVYCDPGFVNVYLVYTPNFHRPSPSPAATSPLPTSSPG